MKLISAWIRLARIERRRAARRRWALVLDRAVQLADLLDRFAIQVEAVGLDYLLIRSAHAHGEIEATRRRLLKEAVSRLDRAVQVLKRDLK